MFLKIFYKLTKKKPTDFEMIEYWKTKESVRAKKIKLPDGSTGMKMEGEKYPFPGYPRGYLLFGSLSPLKHQIKNQIFNETWQKLEEGIDKKEIIKDLKQNLKEILKTIETGKEKDEKSFKMEACKYDMIPPEHMSPAVREIHRAWTKVAPEYGELRDCLTFILQEDDSYRFRLQWIVKFFGWFFKKNPIPKFKFALEMLEHAEVVDDMKGRVKLFRTVILFALTDPVIKNKCEKLFREIDWSKVKLSKGDKYHFRGKYFKVDYPEVEY